MLVYQRVKQIDGKPLAIKWTERELSWFLH
jgi:hypothetical protein